MTLRPDQNRGSSNPAARTAQSPRGADDPAGHGVTANSTLDGRGHDQLVARRGMPALIQTHSARHALGHLPTRPRMPRAVSTKYPVGYTRRLGTEQRKSAWTLTTSAPCRLHGSDPPDTPISEPLGGRKHQAGSAAAGSSSIAATDGPAAAMPRRMHRLVWRTRAEYRTTHQQLHGLGILCRRRCRCRPGECHRLGGRDAPSPGP